MNPASPPTPSAPEPPQESLFASAEGRILFAGLLMAVLLVVALGIGWHLYRESVLVYTVMTGLNLTVGVVAGMTFGYASGFGHLRVIPIAMLVETIQVMVVYPLFVLSWKQLVVLRRLRPYVTRMHRAAESRGALVRKFGIIGLFLFVFVPFWMTGPVVGAIIGFLIGLRPAVNLAVVLVSTCIANIVWALLLNELSAWAGTVNRFAPYALLVAIVLIVLTLQWVSRRRS